MTWDWGTSSDHCWMIYWENKPEQRDYDDEDGVSGDLCSMREMRINRNQITGQRSQKLVFLFLR